MVPNAWSIRAGSQIGCGAQAATCRAAKVGLCAGLRPIALQDSGCPALHVLNVLTSIRQLSVMRASSRTIDKSLDALDVVETNPHSSDFRSLL